MTSGKGVSFPELLASFTASANAARQAREEAEQARLREQRAQDETTRKMTEILDTLCDIVSHAHAHVDLFDAVQTRLAALETAVAQMQARHLRVIERATATAAQSQSHTQPQPANSGASDDDQIPRLERVDRESPTSAQTAPRSGALPPTAPLEAQTSARSSPHAAVAPAAPPSLLARELELKKSRLALLAEDRRRARQDEEKSATHSDTQRRERDVKRQRYDDNRSSQQQRCPPHQQRHQQPPQSQYTNSYYQYAQPRGQSG